MYPAQIESTGYEVLSIPAESVVRITATKLKANRLEILDRPTPEAQLLLVHDMINTISKNKNVGENNLVYCIFMCCNCLNCKSVLAIVN